MNSDEMNAYNTQICSCGLDTAIFHIEDTSESEQPSSDGTKLWGTLSPVNRAHPSFKLLNQYLQDVVIQAEVLGVVVTCLEKVLCAIYLHVRLLGSDLTVRFPCDKQLQEFWEDDIRESIDIRKRSRKTKNLVDD